MESLYSCQIVRENLKGFSLFFICAIIYMNTYSYREMRLCNERKNGARMQ